MEQESGLYVCMYVYERTYERIQSMRNNWTTKPTNQTKKKKKVTKK